MKKFIAFCALLALAGCSNPKSAVIPADSSKWDQLQEPLKRLSDGDRKEAASYMLRMSVAGAFGGGGHPAIPPGITVGDAIKDQVKFEADQKAAEAQAEVAKAKVEVQRAAAISRLNQAITVALTELVVLPKNYEAGRYSDRLSFVYAVANKTRKPISGIKGSVVFKDQFGSEIKTMGLSMDETIPPSSTQAVTGYGKDINQFEASDNKLAVTPLSKMNVTFVPEMVVFSDGTKLSAPDVPEE